MDTNNKNTLDGYISYMDIIGFKLKIEDIEDKDFEKKYKNLIKTISKEFEKDPKVSIYIVSDSIILISQNFSEVKSYTQTIYAWGLRDDFWIRGAIAQGEIIKIDPEEVIKDNKNIIFPYLGKAYVTAYNLESKLNMAGIIIEDNVVSDNPDLKLLENEDYIEYQEYLPKEGYEGKKRLLLPWPNEEIPIINTMYYFREMLKSHSGDIDKYINTFCFYIKLLFRSNISNRKVFLKTLLEQFGRNILIPRKVVIIFISVIDSLMAQDNPDSSKLESDIRMIIEALKKQNFLHTFIDYLHEFDKKRHTSLYKDINEMLSL